MISKLLPLVFLLLGIGAGIGAGVFLSPPVVSHDQQEAKPVEQTEESEAGQSSEFVKLNNQFVVPIVEGERVVSLVVLSLSIETKVSMNDVVYAREPKLRDLFLRVMFDHANMGGFNGSFTQPDMLDVLRASLKDVARSELGDDVEGVLITNIARQDT